MSTETLQVLNVIRRLSLHEKLEVIEMIFKNIKEETSVTDEATEQRQAAAQLLLEDYQNDQDLIAFTALDYEEFYEKN